jgi:hypothetical protein
MLFRVGSGDDVCLVDGGRVDDRWLHDGKDVVDDSVDDGSVAGLAALTSFSSYKSLF